MLAGLARRVSFIEKLTLRQEVFMAVLRNGGGGHVWSTVGDNFGDGGEVRGDAGVAIGYDGRDHGCSGGDAGVRAGERAGGEQRCGENCGLGRPAQGCATWAGGSSRHAGMAQYRSSLDTVSQSSASLNSLSCQLCENQEVQRTGSPVIMAHVTCLNTYTI